MGKIEMLSILIGGVMLICSGIIEAKTRIILPPDSTDIIVCTTDENGTTVCL